MQICNSKLVLYGTPAEAQEERAPAGEVGLQIGAANSAKHKFTTVCWSLALGSGGNVIR